MLGLATGRMRRVEEGRRMRWCGEGFIFFGGCRRGSWEVEDWLCCSVYGDGKEAEDVKVGLVGCFC